MLNTSSSSFVLQLEENELPSAELLMLKLKRQTERIMSLEAELEGYKKQVQTLRTQQQQQQPLLPQPITAAALVVRDTVSSLDNKYLLVLKKLENQTKELEYVQGKYLQARQSQRKQNFDMWKLETLQEKCRGLEEYCQRLEADNNKEEDNDNVRWEEIHRLRLEYMDLSNALQDSRKQVDMTNVQFERTQQLLIAVMDRLQADNAGDIVRKAEELTDKLKRSTDIAKRARDMLQSTTKEQTALDEAITRHFHDKDMMQSLIDNLFASRSLTGHNLANYLKVQVQPKMEQLRGECVLLRHEIDECFLIVCDALQKKRSRFGGLHEAVSELAHKT